MREYTILKCPIQSDEILIEKVMIYECQEGVYVFLYDNVDEDSSGCADYLFEYRLDALKFISEEFCISEEQLITIDNPLPYCQHDTITPVRIRGRNTGIIEWGKLEKLVENKWILIENSEKES